MEYIFRRLPNLTGTTSVSNTTIVAIEYIKMRLFAVSGEENVSKTERSHM